MISRRALIAGVAGVASRAVAQGAITRRRPARHFDARRGVLLPIEPIESPRYVQSLVNSMVAVMGFRSIWGRSAIGTRLVDGVARYASNVVVHKGLIDAECECVDPATGTPLTDYDEIEGGPRQLPPCRRYRQPAMVIDWFIVRQDGGMAIFEKLGDDPIWANIYWPFPCENVTEWLLPESA